MNSENDQLKVDIVKIDKRLKVSEIEYESLTTTIKSVKTHSDVVRIQLNDQAQMYL